MIICSINQFYVEGYDAKLPWGPQTKAEITDIHVSIFFH